MIVLNLNELTKREKEVVDLISKGLSNAKIAKELFISINTVKYHTKNIFQKLEVESRIEIISRLKLKNYTDG